MKTEQYDNINELIKRLTSFESSWIFRGQSNSDGKIWKLESSIERIIESALKNEYDISRFERYSLERFKNKAHHYLSFDESPTSDFAWLSLMQHHGIKTRLIDFTESPFVALFFATSGMSLQQETPGSIFAINYREISKISIKILEKSGINIKYPFLPTENDAIFEKISNNNFENIIWISEPSKSNLRLARQQGTFLFCSNINKNAEEELLSEKYNSDKDTIIKINFPQSLITEINSLMSSINMNYEILYCDIDGFAKDISTSMCIKANKLTSQL